MAGQCSASLGFTLVIREGKVLAWGRDSWGNLGQPGVESLAMPTEIPGLQDIVYVCADRPSSMALDAAGNVYTWGNNSAIPSVGVIVR